MGAVENVREIADLIGNFHDIELNRRILNLRMFKFKFAVHTF